jgi:hypothetical protein
MDAMVKEMGNMEGKGQDDDKRVWDLVPKADMKPGSKEIPSGWVLVKKSLDTGDGHTTYDKHKGRVTAGGHRQQHGRDYDETWSPVVAFPVLRMLIAFAVTHGFDITQIDFDAAYLNALLPPDLDIYMKQPRGFERVGPNGEPMTCKLRRALYGLKQSGRLWYKTLRAYMESEGYHCLDMDQCVFIRHNGDKWVIVVAYVDDLICFSNDGNMKQQFITKLGDTFDISNKGKLQYYLGINIQSHGHTCTLDQRKYIQELLEEFQLGKDSHTVTTPTAKNPSTDETPLSEEEAALNRRMVGCLVYIAIMTRPDISHAVSCASRHLHAPTVRDRVAAMRIYRYLKWTLDYKLTYSTPNAQLHVHVDSDFAGCVETARSQTGVVVLMFGAVISWRSMRQLMVALSTAEAEFMGMCDGTKELIYITQLIEELDIPELQQEGPTYAASTIRTEEEHPQATITPVDNQALLTTEQHTPVMAVVQGDNEGALKMAHEGADNSRTKHMHRRYHFLKELVNTGWLQVKHVASSLNIADGLTKALSKSKTKVMARRLGLHKMV